MLRRTGSSYRHAASLEEAFDPEKGLLSEYAVDKGASEGNLPQFNKSLLVTVNLSSRKLSSGAYLGTLGKKFFDDLYFVLFSRPRHSLFRYGLVRILAWMPEEKGTDPFLPRTVFRRNRMSITLESMAHVTEIAAVPSESISTKYMRWPSLDIEEFATVTARSKGNSAYQVPATRQDHPPAPDLLSIEPISQNLRSLPFTSDASWVAEFLQAEDRLKKEDPEFYALQSNGRLFQKHYKTPLQKAWVTYLRTAGTRFKTHARAVEAVDDARRLIADWKRAIREANGQPLKPALDKQFRTRGDGIDKRIKGMNNTDKTFAEKALDDCRAVDMSPPILLRSRRDSHPLIVHDGEFEPPNRQMALLDVVPHADLLNKLNTHDKMVCYRHVMATFSSHLSKSVVDALKLLVHVGVEEFVGTISGIHDPTKGGWYDLTQLRLRALPADMFIEIALAFEKWPFRPTIETILMATPDTQDAYSIAQGELH